MTIKKFIEELSKYPEDIDLKDVRIRLAVEKEIGYKRIKSVYLGGYRIVGGATPFGSNSVVLERFPNLGDVAKSLLANLKLPRKERAMKVKLKGTSGAPFDVIEVYPETYNGEPTIPFVQYFCDEEGTIYKDELLEFVTDG